jgi:hypothetical protein
MFDGRQDDAHAHPKTQSPVFLSPEGFSDLLGDSGGIEEEPEFHAEEQRHEHHAAGVALGHVLAQLLPVLHRPGQVPSPDTEMIDRNEELSGFQKTEQGYPGLRRIIAPVIDAARALLQRKRLVRHVEELTVCGRPFESRWKRFSCLV